MTKALNTIGTGLLSITAVEGAPKIAEAMTEAASAPDYSQLLQIILQIVVSFATLVKLFKPEKNKKEQDNVNGQ
jgi:hypothetical protein